MSRIKKIVGAFIHAPDRFDELAQRISDVNTRAEETEKGLGERIYQVNSELTAVRAPGWVRDQLGVDPDRLQGDLDRLQDQLASMQNIGWIMDQLCENRDHLQRLNRGLSIAPTIWGDPEKLEIDETAKVVTCFFNTISGRIRVGAYSFAGSRVSLLAGAHDPELTGVLRRDAEQAEGCDIEIGEGVWLASGCTLLGPCVVGDNAVIAAGAVVTPGTRVPAGTVWAGVPARQIRVLDLREMTADEPAVVSAFRRSGGMLFAEGWGERIAGLLAEPGHWMYKQEARLFTDRKDWRLLYRRERKEPVRIRMEGSAGTAAFEFTESEGECALMLPIAGTCLEEVRLYRNGDEAVFLSFASPLDAEKEKPEDIPETGKPEGIVPEEETPEEEGILDIEAIMEEIRAEARKNAPFGDIPSFGEIRAEEETESPELTLAQDIRKLTENCAVPPATENPTRNPLKKLYRKVTRKAVRSVTDPLSASVTETNLAFRKALEEAAQVIEQQQRQMNELARRLQRQEKES